MLVAFEWLDWGQSDYMYTLDSTLTFDQLFSRGCAMMRTDYPGVEWEWKWCDDIGEMWMNCIYRPHGCGETLSQSDIHITLCSPPNTHRDSWRRSRAASQPVVHNFNVRLQNQTSSRAKLGKVWLQTQNLSSGLQVWRGLRIFWGSGLRPSDWLVFVPWSCTPSVDASKSLHWMANLSGASANFSRRWPLMIQSGPLPFMVAKDDHCRLTITVGGYRLLRVTNGDHCLFGHKQWSLPSLYA